MHGDSVEQLSQEVRALRTKMGWTQEDLAQEVDVSIAIVVIIKESQPRCDRLHDVMVAAASIGVSEGNSRFSRNIAENHLRGQRRRGEDEAG